MLKFIAMAALAALTCSQGVSTGGSNILSGDFNTLSASTSNAVLGNRNRFVGSSYNNVFGDLNSIP